MSKRQSKKVRKKEKYFGHIAVLYASFYYFAITMQENNYVNFNDRLKKFFHKLGLVTKIYEKRTPEAVEVLIKVAKKWEEKNQNKRIDYMLASISIIAVYYEQTKVDILPIAKARGF